MHGKNLYEYAVLRYVPHVEREEFLNVGLVMMCKRRRWIRAAVHLCADKLKSLNAPHSVEEIMHQLGTFTATAEGSPKAGPLAKLPAEERFRWLTAVKSSSLQTSRPHPGETDVLDDEFDRLFNILVK